MNDRAALKDLERHIARRASRRGLHIDLARLGYANRALLEPLPAALRRALYVGVGHGHDALLALLEGRVSAAVGVDPYREPDGNGDAEYGELRSLIGRCGLADRFVLARETVQEFLARDRGSYDLIIIADVLHHIFPSAAPLRRSGMFDAAAGLFGALRRRAAAGAFLAVSDVQRSGVRPWLHRVGLLRGAVDYSTKQNWREWERAALRGGWTFARRASYVPWALRAFAPLLRGKPGLLTVCDRYFLYFSNGLA